MSNDRAAACLIGKALGDALGFVVEGYPPVECKAYVDDILRAGKAGVLGRGRFAFGQYTDDTQLARLFLESLCHSGGFEVEDYGQRIGQIFRSKSIVGRGRATELAAGRLIAGTSALESGTPAPSAGNGSAMRAGVVGLSPARPERRIEVARIQGEVTHRDPRCSAGAVIMAVAVAANLRTPQPSPEALLSELQEALEGLPSEDFQRGLEELPRWRRLCPAEAASEIGSFGKPAGFDDGWRGISPFVLPSVLWSLYAFLRTPDDAWEALMTAIEVGGDVDTTAAMTGALVGSRLGLGALPEALCIQLNDQGSWGFDELVELAEDAALIEL